ncbi:MAG TPA: hypothetical protein VFA98_13020 [Thermoanaerobaculia bacterium]|jgi:predicted amidohydrolase|nr:hypothetical protein [Thermoanaerobaculia bacterium]
MADRPEDFVYEEWQRHRRSAARARGPEGQAEVAIADTLQYLLQDWSDYGHSLVWGQEGRRREKGKGR